MRGWQIWLGGAVVVLAIAAVAVGIARGASPTTPTGDMAVIESYTIEASAGHLLVGPYSRFQWHHPGPIYFYALAPFYLASHRDSTGLAAGAVAINIAMIVLAILAAAYGGGPVFGVTVGLAAALFALRADDLLSSAWNPHMAVLPIIVTIVAGAAAASGAPWFLPLAAFSASFAAETHVGTLPVSMLIGGAAAVFAAISAGRASARSGWWKPFAATLVAVAVFWLPSIVEQARSTPGNFTALWAFFSAGTADAPPFRTAFVDWAHMMAGVVRPDFHIARGLPLRVAHSWATQAWAIGEMVLLALVATVSFRTRRRFELVLSLFLLAASLVALGSVSRIQGEVVDHEIFWISALGALGAAVVIGAFARLAMTAGTPGALSGAPPDGTKLAVPAAALCALLIGACAWSGLTDVARLRARSVSDAMQSNPITRAATGVREYLSRQGVERPFIDIDQKSWSLAAGVLLQLQKAGVPYAVDDDWLPMFTDLRKATGQERQVLSIAGAERHVMMTGLPGVVAVLAADPIYVDAYGASSNK